uniref:Putative secreted protein n=1 Tax=Anopheles marajoara TaxID=58244 RepID=A0A2M4C7H9_9DIPT
MLGSCCFFLFSFVLYFGAHCGATSVKSKSIASFTPIVSKSLCANLWHAKLFIFLIRWDTIFFQTGKQEKDCGPQNGGHKGAWVGERESYIVYEAPVDVVGWRRGYGKQQKQIASRNDAVMS